MRLPARDILNVVFTIFDEDGTGQGLPHKDVLKTLYVDRYDSQNTFEGPLLRPQAPTLGNLQALQERKLLRRLYRTTRPTGSNYSTRTELSFGTQLHNGTIFGPFGRGLTWSRTATLAASGLAQPAFAAPNFFSNLNLTSWRELRTRSSRSSGLTI